MKNSIIGIKPDQEITLASKQQERETLTAIRKMVDDLGPKLVLDDARDEDALLHPCFEWDDEKAAELYRERQAGFLIRNLTIRVEREDKPPLPVRAFVSVEKEESRAFVGTIRALSEEETRAQVLQEALQSLQVFRTKYEAFAELGGVIAAIGELNL